jgi:hypothetical protein
VATGAHRGADSGFPREDPMARCEANGVDFVLGLAQNKRLTGVAYVSQPALAAGASVICEKVAGAVGSTSARRINQGSSRPLSTPPRS